MVGGHRLPNYSVAEDVDLIRGPYHDKVDLSIRFVGRVRKARPGLHRDRPVLLQSNEDGATRPAVEVAGQNDRIDLPTEIAGDRVCLSHPFGLGACQMNGYDREHSGRASVNADLDLVHRQRTPRRRRDCMRSLGLDGQPGKDRIAVVPTLVRTMRPVNSLVPEKLSENGHLIDPIGPLRSVIDLLEGDHVGIKRDQHTGDARKIDLIIHASTMLHVVRGNAHDGLGRHRRRQCQDQGCKQDGHSPASQRLV